MTWLSGKPRTFISLRWPTDDPIIETLKQQLRRHEASPFTLCPYSVLDDQILRAVVRGGHSPNSYIYLARKNEAIANDTQQVTFTVCAVLPYVVHQAALLPDRAGFVSLTFDKEYVQKQSFFPKRINIMSRIFTITLRIHNWDGSSSKETSTHAVAVYNRLVIREDLIGICVSSGEEPGIKLELEIIYTCFRSC